jgi:VWFA-related protein
VLARALTVMSFLALVPAPLAQVAKTGQDQTAITTLRVETQIVVLDVVVTDKKGNSVTNLTRDDFTILENKLPQTIRSFDPPSAHQIPSGTVVSSSADLSKIRDAPVTILVLDELNTRFEDMSYARNSTVKYLQSQPATLRQPTQLLLATNTRFSQLHDYSQNRDELIAQIQHHIPEYPNKMMNGPGGAAAVERMAQSLASLEQIAQASTGIPGRKNVIWVGNGFPSANLQSLDDRTAETIEQAIQRCTDMLLAARVTMYTINPTANTTTTIDVQTPDDLAMAENENGGQPYAGSLQFATLAPLTGGRAFLSRNDINNEIAEGIDAGTSYYTLSYSPVTKNDAAPKYRNIRITIKNPDLHATTRDGYYATKSPSQDSDSVVPVGQVKAQLQLDIASAMNSAMVYNGLNFTATKDGADYVLRVKTAGLDWRAVGPSAERAEVTAIVAWYNARGKVLGHIGRELTADRQRSADRSIEEETVFRLIVPTLPGTATRLRFLLRDAVSSRMGTVDLRP